MEALTPSIPFTPVPPHHVISLSCNTVCSVHTASPSMLFDHGVTETCFRRCDSHFLSLTNVSLLPPFNLLHYPNGSSATSYGSAESLTLGFGI